MRIYRVSVMINIIEPLTYFTGKCDGPASCRHVWFFLKAQEANLSYVDGADLPRKIADALEDPPCYKNNRMQKVKNWVTDFQKILQDLLQNGKEKAQQSVLFLKERMASMN